MRIITALVGIVLAGLLSACAGPGGPGTPGVTITTREPVLAGSQRPNGPSMGPVLICSNERALITSVRRGTLAQVLSRHYPPARGCYYDIPGDGRDIRLIGYATTRDGYDVRLLAFRYEGTRVVWFTIQPPDTIIFSPRRPRHVDRYYDPRDERPRGERLRRDDRGAGTRAKDRARKWLKKKL